MRANFLLPLLLAVTLSACSSFGGEIPSKAAHFDGLEARPVDLPAFDRIVFNADAKITLRMGSKPVLILSTEPDHFTHLNAIVTDGELLIEHTGHHSGRRYVKLDIVTPDLSAIKIDANVNAELSGIEVGDITIDFDGIGEITIEGSCQRVTYNISSIGEFDASRFLCQDVVAQISGIGDATIFADGNLSLVVSGIGDVTVVGKPRIDKIRSRGIGSVSFSSRD